MHDIKYQLGNSALILSKKTGELLAVHRKYDSSKVCFPGGKLDPNETSLDCVVREIKEETGLDLKSLVTQKNQGIPLYSGICDKEDQANDGKSYWVNCHVFFIEHTTNFENAEPEMMPEWMCWEEFLSKTSFPLFNQQVFNAYLQLIEN